MVGMNGASDDLGVQLTPELIQQIVDLLQQAGHPAQKTAVFKKAASEAASFRLSGRYRAGGAKTARERAIQDKMRVYLAEAVQTALSAR